ncbi:hypothetical protein [Blastococcus jejuensis]|uniref:hypothetical protein n=1 Tax=Blastococcus jejuensis TaxID=351224 RepID=UPI0031D572C0
MNEGSSPSPEEMRGIVQDYVRTVHVAYLGHARHLAPGDQGRLPLVAAGHLTVVAAASRDLHLVATTDRLPPPRGQEVELEDEYDGTTWALRFYDPTVAPQLGVLAEDTPEAVRQALGISDVVYHLTVSVGGGLTGHHAQHSGVALANRHSSTARDLARLRAAHPRDEALVGELDSCVRLGLHRAAALLAREITSGRIDLPAGTPADASVAALLLDAKR